MSISQILRILLARKWMVLAAFMLCSVVGAAVTIFVLPKQFTADATMVFDIRPDPILGMQLRGLSDPAYLATQIEIIKSDRVAIRAVEILGLAKSPSALKQWRESTHSKISIERFFAGLLQRGLVVETLRGSNVITLTFVSADSGFAAAAANAFAQSYMETSVALRVDPTRQSAEFLQDETKTLRSNLEAAQAKLTKYQQEHGIIVNDERLDQETARLTTLSTQLAQAQAEHVEAMSRQRNSGGDASPDVQSSPAVQALRAQLAAAETRMSEMKNTLGVNHPQRVQLESQIAELKQQLSREVGRVSGSSAIVSRGTAQKVEEIRGLVEAQKKRLLSMSGDRDQVSVLQREVDTAKRAFEAASTRSGQLVLEAKNTQADVRLLTAAVEPLDPSRPNVNKNIAVSAVLGLVLGLGLAIGLEFLDRRVRDPEDLLVAAGVPVLGVLRPADSKRPVYRQLLPARPGLPQLPPGTPKAAS